MTLLWQLEKAKFLNLKVVHIHNYENQGEILRNPSEIISIDADGNCLFRALSYWITGSQENHIELRKLIADVIKNFINMRLFFCYN